MGLLDSPLWVEVSPFDAGLVNTSEQTRRVILGTNASRSLQVMIFSNFFLIPPQNKPWPCCLVTCLRAHMVTCTEHTFRVWVLGSGVPGFGFQDRLCSKPC